MIRNSRKDDNWASAIDLRQKRMNGIKCSFPMLVFVLFFFFLKIFSCAGQPGKKIDVYVAGFFPMGDGPKQSLGRGVMPALDLAVKHVNEHKTTLRNYKLHVVWNDTKCNTAIATKNFFDIIKKPPHKLMLFGAACTLVTDPIAKAARHWHITQLSYADTHPMFSAAKYPNFFQMAPSEKEFNMPRVHLLQSYNWTRIGTLFQNVPRHALAHNHLLSLLDKRDEFEIAETQSFADELKDQLKKLLEKDVRIILGYFDEKWARKIFCEAHKVGLYGRNYQWIITGMYRKEWWNITDNETDKMKEENGNSSSLVEDKCLVKDIKLALEGCIMTDLLPLSSDNNITVSGKNVTQYGKAYSRNRGHEYSRFHGYTYDGVWAMALAIQEVGQTLGKRNFQHSTNKSIKDFRYRDKDWGDLFRNALSSVEFQGVTGPVRFTDDNTRKGYILLKQFQDGKEVKIGEYDGIKEVLQLDKGHDIYWPGGKPPLDRTVRKVEKTSVSLGIYVPLVILSSFGIIMATTFLIINIRFRNQRYIKMSSPHLNNLIIIGCMFTYMSVILLGLDSSLTSESFFPMICAARGWVLMSGFTLAFGSMFSKTWRVHSIFTDLQLNKKVIKDYQLFIVVFVLLFIDILIMTTWQIVDPFRRDTKLITPYKRDDIEIIPENEYCMSDNMSIFIGCIYAYKGLLMVFGCFLAWETRLVSIPALNDSKYIGMSVYNVVIMCVIGVPISYILSDKQDAMYIIISIFILFCTTGTLCLVFMPKIIELRRNPQGNIDKRMVRGTLKPPKRNDSDSDVSDLHDQIKKAEGDREVFTKKLKDKEGEMKQLVVQLGDDAAMEDQSDGSRPQSPRRTSRLRSIERLKLEGHSIAETTEATELSSLCSSAISQDEYVAVRPHCVSSSISTFSPITTTSIHNLQHDNHHSLQCENQLPVGVTAGHPPVDCLSRRAASLTSPDQTSRDVTKSVSFRLENSDSSTIEAIPILHIMSRPTSSNATSSPSPIHSPPHIPPHATYMKPAPPSLSSQYQPTSRGHHVASTPPPPPFAAPNLPQRTTSSTQKIYQHQFRDSNVLEREGAAYGGYGGVYVHDYGGPMIQNDKFMYQERRGSRENGVNSRRTSRTDPLDVVGSNFPTTHGYNAPSIGARISAASEIIPNIVPRPAGPLAVGTASIRGTEASTEIPRRSSLRIAADTYSHLHRNIYIPLNNEDKIDNFSAQGPRRSRDLTIINDHTVAPSPSIYKNSNYDANIFGSSSIAPQNSVGRRGSEPPRPVGRNQMHLKNRSFDDLGATEYLPPEEQLLREAAFRESGERNIGWRASLKRDEERDRDRETRTISRAHLRRDSFGEVVSRRSPSQDSLELSRTKSSPEADDGDILPLPVHDALVGTEDVWSCPSLSRHSPSQDSLQRNDNLPRERIPSQESLGTMSSRGSVSGSIYSVASARSDAAVTRWSKDSRRTPHRQQMPASTTSGGSFLNGDLSESAVSTDDLAHQAAREGYREPVGLHRTSSEPYYNFESLDIPDGTTLRHQLHGLTMGQSDYQSAYEPETRTLGRHRNHSNYGGFGEIIESGAFVGYTQTLRGRSRATTSSVAAALAAAKSKNASDNALDHDTSILPIFQKLLSERQRSFSGRGARNYTMSSCPNITIKCDIVEYL